ncbi:hypothetical protein GUJ93_ZPchr0006g44225 [Zizania palustris]|uniref:Exocyst subunit Exo70 family protein n=1 Tax=Zizania palustris TaxID=103762 RepID=A0A8J5TAD6_ZIZPA|nr:hypothetical protein GUJ93_ZPchr0006g44225 [Zizania palustris]
MGRGDGERAAASIAAAARSLRAGVEKSRALGQALARAGPRLDEIQLALPALEAAVRPIRAPRAELSAAGPHIDRAVGPAAAVLKVFDAVHGLEPPLLAGGAVAGDLPGYLAVLGRLEEALRFLSDNSGLAAQWLADIVEYLGDHDLADPRFLADLAVTLEGLEKSSGDLDGGLLAAALNMLEAEFRCLLAGHSSPLAIQQLNTASASVVPSLIPAATVHKLSLILDRLIANGRQDRCLSMYADARGGVVSASLHALGLDYLRNPFDDAQALGPGVELWGRHLEFVVCCLLESERQLCNKVFGQHKDGASACFAEVAAHAGVLDFLKFGHAAADTKKDPIKLLRLLEVFDSLNKLRLDFNRLFGGKKACAEIQSQTRDLVKLLVDGAVEIFEELLVQVELQRHMPPPSDGGVPRLVSFVVEYCNRLLGEKYRPVLAQVLTIHRSWRKEAFSDKMLVNAVLNIVKALEANFDVWSKAYDNVTLSCLFMMNTHWHFFKNLKASKLGKLLGDVWLQDHEQFKDYYLTVFMRDSWGALSPLLNREGLILFSKGRATAKDLVKQRLKTFNASFDEMFRKQSAWVIPDKGLREKTCALVVQSIVPSYRSYMQNYGPLVEQDASANKYVKYTVDGLEKMLSALFIPRPRRAGSFQIRHSNDNITSPMTGLYRSTSTVK